MAQALRSPRVRRQPEAPGRHITRSDLWLHPRHFRGRHHAAAIFVVAVLAVVGFRLFPNQDVTVLSNGQSFRVSAAFDPAQEALRAADIQVGPGDVVRYGAGGRFASASVQRARPVTITIDGRAVALQTQAGTIAGALAEAGIALRPGDRVYLNGRLASARGSLVSTSYASRATPLASGSAGPVDLGVVRAVPVAVSIDAFRLDLSSAAPTVAALLAELGITVREGDLVHPALDTPITAATAIRLAKGRTVTVRLDGKEQALYTRAVTVADVVRALGVELGPEDVVTPGLSEVITQGMAVTIATTRLVTEVVEEPVAPTLETAYDASLSSGIVSYKDGVPGKQLVTYELTLKNGEAVDRKPIHSELVQAAIPSQQTIGTKQTKPPKGGAVAASGGTVSVDGYTGPYQRKVTVWATWYNASGGAWARDDPNYGTTKSGIKVDRGVCAVDESYIPMGTRFWVPGYGMCIAADTGGLVTGNHIDLGYPESDGNPGWGARTVEIYIID